MRIITITSIVLLTISQLRAQSFLGQNVPDVTETDCNNNTERIYDVLATGKPILIFKTDLIILFIYLCARIAQNILWTTNRSTV